MPYNGVGVFTSLGPPTFPAVPNTYILASYFNATMYDIFSGLSSALTRDGQSPMLANLPMAGYKITGMAAGAALGEAVEWNQVFVSPTFTNPILAGIPTAPTAAVGTNTTQIATMAALINQAFATALPLISQDTYNSGVTNDGANPSWDDSAADSTANLNAWFSFF